MPLGREVGTNIEQLTEENRGRKEKRPRKQILAIALDAARRAGADIPPAPAERRARRRGSR